MDIIKEAIDNKRNIKPNSLKAYLISLQKTHDFIEGEGELEDLNFLKNEEEVVEKLQDLKLSTQKNYLSAIIVALDAMNDEGDYDSELEYYRGYLAELQKQHQEEQQKQQKTKSQDENWASMKELRKVMTKYKADIMERELLTKPELNRKQFDLVQKWVVANLFLDDENPPTRLDYAPMKVIKEEDFEKLSDDEKDDANYLVLKSRNKKYFHFGEYKTAKKYGANVIPVGKKLNSVLNIWLRINPTDSLLLNSQGKPQTANGLGKYITKVFEPTGKKIGINLLRHIFITEKFAPQLDEKKDVASKMGHSVGTQELYAKK
jgi:hypothetical protein